MIPCGVQLPLGLGLMLLGSYWWSVDDRKRRKGDRFGMKWWQQDDPIFDGLLWVPAWIIYVVIYFTAVWKQALVIIAGAVLSYGSAVC